MATPDSPAVRMWRDQYRLNLSPGRKQDIDLTIDDLALWGRVLQYAKVRKWNPLMVQWLLGQYEEWRREH